MLIIDASNGAAGPDRVNSVVLLAAAHVIAHGRL